MRIVFFTLILLIISGCSFENKKKTEVLCSTSIIADCVQNIVGNRIKVNSLMGIGVDPHSYKPRPTDVSALSNAQMIVYSGLHLEGKMVELFEELKQYKTVVAVADYFPKEVILRDDKGIEDPHIWFNVPEWTKALAGITEQLCKEFPAHSDEFKVNYKVYKAKCDVKFNYWKDQINHLPKNKRILITSHDAFHYFGKSFSCQVKALQGISTVQEASIGDVSNLILFIRKNSVKTLFIENSVNPKTLKALLSGASHDSFKVQLGGELFSDALGSKKRNANTYLSMINSNVFTLLNAWKE